MLCLETALTNYQTNKHPMCEISNVTDTQHSVSNPAYHFCTKRRIYCLQSGHVVSFWGSEVPWDKQAMEHIHRMTLSCDKMPSWDSNRPADWHQACVRRGRHFAKITKSFASGRSESTKKEISRNSVESSERVSGVFLRSRPPWMMLCGWCIMCLKRDKCYYGFEWCLCVFNVRKTNVMH